MISVIIPVLNEIDSLPELMDQLRKVLHIYSKWEILFVDDGSTDGSTEFLYDLSRKDENVTHDGGQDRRQVMTTLHTDPSKCINDHTLRSDTEFRRT